MDSVIRLFWALLYSSKTVRLTKTFKGSRSNFQQSQNQGSYRNNLVSETFYTADQL